MGEPVRYLHVTLIEVENREDNRNLSITLEWMQCPHQECREILVRVQWKKYNPSQPSFRFPLGGKFETEETDQWFAVPKRPAQRPIDTLVPEKFVRNYREAALVLDLSPSASAMLSRRVLADLLEEYAMRKEYGLADRIDEFNKETQHPSGLRRNLHTLREMGDFSAHTKTDDQAKVIDVDRDEAEWTLDVIDRLFDYFIITPARDTEMRRGMAEKMEKAGRRPTNPLPDEEDTRS